MKTFLILLTSSCLVFADPLPSWNDGAPKKAVIEFVEAVTDPQSDDFVPVDHRIAVFDNDGTLWCEYPVPPQAAFAFDEIKRLAPSKPEWKDNAAVQACLKGDVEALKANHYQLLIEALKLSHAGMTVDEFNQQVKAWLETARHPRFDRPYSGITYQPMLEVLTYLRDKGFQTWIVSGGGMDFMRVFSEEVYGIPTQQIIGSHGQVKFEMRDEKPTLIKSLETLFIDDKEGKPVGIHTFIGKQPIACFGNSDGDKEMLEYTTIDNPYRSLGLIVHHTDAEREYAYDRNPKGSGKLDAAMDDAAKRKWILLDMKKEWSTVFPSKSEP